MTLHGWTRRLLWTAFFGLPTALLAFGVWSGYQAKELNSELGAAVDDANVLQAALRSGDQRQAGIALEAMQADIAAATERTGSRTWSVLTYFPVFGDDAEGVRLVAEVVKSLADSGIAPLVDQASDLDALAPSEGRLPIKTLIDLQAPVAEASEIFTAADARLSAADPTGYLWPLRPKFEELATRVSDAASALASADTALQVMPSMLGADGPRTYLLVFQNNAEVRATGGLPGAVSILQADEGKLSMTEQVTGSSLGEAERPALPLTPGEREVYGPQLGTYFLDANFTPDFPRAAALMQARWQQVYGDRIDGVIAVDPVAMSYLLDAMGPVDVEGRTLTSANAVQELLSEVYLRESDPEIQDDFFADVARSVFTSVTNGGGDPRGLLENMARGAREHRVLVHSFAPNEQAVLAGTPVAGDLMPSDPARPQVGIYLNDNTGSKMSYYLRMPAVIEETSCSGDAQRIQASAVVSSIAPADAATSLPPYVTGGGFYGIDPGSQIVAVRMYAPAGGSIEEYTIDGQAQKRLPIVELDGRDVLTSYIQVGPQESVDLGWTVVSGPGQTGDIDFAVTPGVEPVSTISTVPSAC
ncbi:DUF4012 domain-containing protein [Nocardioides sp.]|uniref:DUF4012 domain-containing protein n=1 Tax=Nocardioides sp. TaxID=35761 RepID=UPI0035622A5C